MLYKLQARSSRAYSQSSLCVLYGLDWEDCEGADSLTLEECRELQGEWIKDDRLNMRAMYGAARFKIPHQYQIVAMPE